MNPFVLAYQEIVYRWKSSGLVVMVVAAVTGMLAFFSLNSQGYQKEIGRNARDLGSNVVLLPADVDQLEYFSRGGYSEVTMPQSLVDQLIEYKASLNHLIPMLERKAMLHAGKNVVETRVIGISASIAMPGRPKSPMQKTIPEGTLQLGSTLAAQLGIGRDDESARVVIEDREFVVSRVNRVSGTWQDVVAFVDLPAAQALFNQPGRISRIEAIECTSEQCEQTGLSSDIVLTNQLTHITDQAALLRKERMADTRSQIRALSRDNFRLLQNALWVLLAVSMVGLTSLNSFQRESEIGLLQAVGYGQIRIMLVFMLRASALTLLGAAVGVAIGMLVSWTQSGLLFSATGKKLAVDWASAMKIGFSAALLAIIASSFPAILAATKNPVELIGKS